MLLRSKLTRNTTKKLPTAAGLFTEVKHTSSLVTPSISSTQQRFYYQKFKEKAKQEWEDFKNLPLLTPAKSKSDKLLRTYSFLITLYIIYLKLSEKDDGKSITNLPALTDDFYASQQRNELRIKLGTFNNKGGVNTTIIWGPSGLGKTELALDYAYTEKNKLLTGTVTGIRPTLYFFNATSIVSFEESYLNFAKALHIPVTLPKQELIASVNQALTKRPGFILIIDNVTDYTLIQDYLPMNSLQNRVRDYLNVSNVLRGKVIITSQQAPKASMQIDTLPLTGWDITKDCLPYIDKILGNKKEQYSKSEKKTLAIQLAGSPLALRLATLKLKYEANLKLAEYLSVLKTELGEISSTVAAADYENIHACVTKDAINPLKKDTSNILANEFKAAYPLLRFMAFLGPRDIPDTLLKDYVKNEFMLVEDSAFVHLMDFLKDLGIVQISADYKTFMIHEAIQKQVRAEENITLDWGKAIEFFADKLDANFIFRSADKEKLVGHVRAVLQYKPDLIDNNLMRFAIAQLNIAAGSYLMQQGLAHQAPGLLSAAKEMLEFDSQNKLLDKTPQQLCNELAKIDKSLPTRYANALYMFSRIYFYQQEGDMPSDLEKCLETALAMRDIIDVNKSEHYDDSQNKNGYTQIYKRSGKALLLLLRAERTPDETTAKGYLKEAKDLLDRLKDQKKDDAFYQAACAELLAKVYLQEARYLKNNDTRSEKLDKALQLISNPSSAQKPGAIECLLNNSKKNYNRLGKFYNVLGNIYFEKGDLIKAEEAYKECLSIEQGKKDFPAADAHLGLAKVYYYMPEKEEKAQQHIKKTIEIQTLYLNRSAKHPDVIEARGWEITIEPELAYQVSLKI
jgi:hypothetical protein